MREWKQIRDLPYEVSNDGLIRSMGRWVSNGKAKRWVAPAERKIQPHTSGYVQVKLYDKNIGINCYVHILVAEAFVPNPFNLPQVNHKHPDGDKTRNIDSNLEWSTQQDNLKHSRTVLFNKAPIGERHGMAKLTENEVRVIRDSKEPRKVLAFKFGISRSTVAQIIRRERWKHLD